MTGGGENDYESAILLSNTGPSIVCTCLVVFETLVPMHFSAITNAVSH